MPNRTAKATSISVPAIIAEAGTQSIAVYHSFLTTHARTPSTRKTYRKRIGSFCYWAKDHGLTLATVTASEAAAYAAFLAVTRSRNTASTALSPLRGLFGVLARSGVIAGNPFASMPPYRHMPDEQSSPERQTAGCAANRTPMTVSDLMSLRAQVMSDLAEHPDDDATVDLLRSIDRKLAAMPRQEASDGH